MSRAHPRPPLGGEPAVPGGAPRSSGVASSEHLGPVAIALALLRPIGPGAIVYLRAGGPGREPAAPFVELHMYPGADVVEVMLGEVAPSDALAAGVCAPARSYHLDHPDHRTSGPLVHLVDVHGVSITVLPGADDRPGSLGPVIGPTAEPQIGRVADVSRRLLGLPTAPPPAIDVGLLAQVWLTRAAFVAADTIGLDWPSVVRLVPGRPPTGLTPVALAAVLHAATHEWRWNDVRRQVARGEVDLAARGVSPTEATWMDDGMFARWVLGELLPVPLALDIIDAMATPATADLLRATLSLAGATPRGAPA